jgi:hypothetical protein
MSLTNAAFALELPECMLWKEVVASLPHIALITPAPPGWSPIQVVRLYTPPLTTDQQSATVLWAVTWAREKVVAAGVATVVAAVM